MGRLLSSIAIVIIVLSSCVKRVERRELGETRIQMKECVNWAVRGDRLQICYDSLVYDARCPSDVVCVWSGPAVVKLRLKLNNGQEQGFRLSTSNHTPFMGVTTDTVLQGYRIKLLEVGPRRSNGTGDDYVKILVSR